MQIKAKIDGAPELYKALREIDKKLARKALRSAIGEAAKVVLKTAKTLVPVDLGLLKASLSSKVVVKDGRAVAIIGPRRTRGTVGKGANRRKNQLTSFGKSKAGQKAIAFRREPVRYAHLVEFGTRGQRGVIRNPGGGPAGGEAEKRRGGGRRSGFGRKHGTRGAQPFLRPALDNNAITIKSIIRTRLEQAIDSAGVS